MLKRVLVLDGVVAVCQFQDDGSVIDAAGLIPDSMMERLSQFALWYRRMIAGNSDLLSLFSQMNGWTPARGWIVHGADMSVCCVTNLVCMVENKEASINEIMSALEEVSHH